MKSLFASLSLLFAVGVGVAGCQPGYVDGRLRSLPDRPWPCSYVWPGFQKEKTRVKLTKPVCREAAPERTIRAVLDSTALVYIYRYDAEKKTTQAYLGTGSVIGTDGTVVTAHHVIDGAVTAYVMYRTREPDGQAYGFGPYIPVRVTHDSARHDTAILVPYSQPAVVPPPLTVCRQRPHAGDVLWHVGYRTAWSVGTVGRSPIDFEESGEPIKVHGFGYVTLGYFGDSGGPIFDGNGRLWGLYVALSELRPINGFGTALDAAFTALNYHAQFEGCD